ncbi:MAG: histidine triad nucleotide-binding protein [Microbacteriaceae bacterium]|nr:histidine triad nucleotide-binding protein [Microbacteriaceae bacterium]
MSQENGQEASIFTRIINREIPASIVKENESLIAFNDIAPQAPVHILVVPKDPSFRNVVELATGNSELLSEMIAFAKEIADEYCDGEFRLVFNTGENAGQTVFHVHAHILGGKLSEGSL